jgi:hypothetical protein
MLLPSQKREVERCLKEAGLDLSEFEWKDPEKPEGEMVLSHTPTQFYFKFTRDDRGSRQSVYSPGDTVVVTKSDDPVFENQFATVTRWARYLRRELDAERDSSQTSE